MSKEKNGPFVAVRAIILREDKRILLLKRASNDAYGELWCLPGGKIDFGQTSEEAITREVKEETSLTCSRVCFLFYKDGLPQNEGEDHYLTLYFKCRVDGEIVLNKESSDFRWLEPAELDKYDIAFKNDEAIREYLKEQKEI